MNRISASFPGSEPSASIPCAAVRFEDCPIKGYAVKETAKQKRGRKNRIERKKVDKYRPSFRYV
jgi:hypothetical protein